MTVRQSVWQFSKPIRPDSLWWLLLVIIQIGMMMFRSVLTVVRLTAVRLTVVRLTVVRLTVVRLTVVQILMLRNIR